MGPCKDTRLVRERPGHTGDAQGEGFPYSRWVGGTEAGASWEWRRGEGGRLCTLHWRSSWHRDGTYRF